MHAIKSEEGKMLWVEIIETRSIGNGQELFKQDLIESMKWIRKQKSRQSRFIVV